MRRDLALEVVRRPHLAQQRSEFLDEVRLDVCVVRLQGQRRRDRRLWRRHARAALSQRLRSQWAGLRPEVPSCPEPPGTHRGGASAEPHRQRRHVGIGARELGARAHGTEGRRPCCCAAGRCRQSPKCAPEGPRQSAGGTAAVRGGSSRCAWRRRGRQGCGAACAENKRDQLALRRPLSALARTARRRLVRVARTYSTEAPGRTCQHRGCRLPQSAVQHVA